MNSAIQLNPAGILTSGIPNSTIQAQLTLAAQKGIWVNSSAIRDGLPHAGQCAGADRFQERISQDA